MLAELLLKIEALRFAETFFLTGIDQNVERPRLARAVDRVQAASRYVKNLGRGNRFKEVDPPIPIEMELGIPARSLGFTAFKYIERLTQEVIERLKKKATSSAIASGRSRIIFTRSDPSNKNASSYGSPGRRRNTQRQ